MKLRVTIETKESEDTLSRMNSVNDGTYGIDRNGVYHMFYGNRTDLVEFTDVEVLEHEHDYKQMENGNATSTVCVICNKNAGLHGSGCLCSDCRR